MGRWEGSACPRSRAHACAEVTKPFQRNGPTAELPRAGRMPPPIAPFLMLHRGIPGRAAAAAITAGHERSRVSKMSSHVRMRRISPFIHAFHTRACTRTHGWPVTSTRRSRPWRRSVTHSGGILRLTSVQQMHAQVYSFYVEYTRDVLKVNRVFTGCRCCARHVPWGLVLAYYLQIVWIDIRAGGFEAEIATGTQTQQQLKRTPREQCGPCQHLQGAPRGSRGCVCVRRAASASWATLTPVDDDAACAARSMRVFLVESAHGTVNFGHPIMIRGDLGEESRCGRRDAWCLPVRCIPGNMHVDALQR